MEIEEKKQPNQKDVDYFLTLPGKVFQRIAKKYGIAVEQREAEEIIGSVEIVIPGVKTHGIEETTNGKFVVSLMQDNEDRIHIALGTVKRKDKQNWWSCLCRFNGQIEDLRKIPFHNTTNLNLHQNNNGVTEGDRSWEDYLAVALLFNCIGEVIKDSQ